MAVLLIFLGYLFILVPLGVILNGWVLATLWEWFLADITTVTLSIPVAIGLSLIVKLLHFDSSKINIENSRDKVGSNMILPFAAPLVSLFFGWIVQLFI